jgi:hypothetical protein
MSEIKSDGTCRCPCYIGYDKFREEQRRRIEEEK